MKQLFLITVLMLTACAKDETKIVRSDEEQDRIIREVVLKEMPEFSTLSNDIDSALKIVSFVHFRTKIIGGLSQISMYDRADNVINVLHNPNYGHICGGFGVTAVDVLRAFGFRARIVQIFENATPGQVVGHVTTEVEINDAWVAADPTFNAVFTDENDELLNYKQMFERHRAGIAITYRYINDSKFKIEDSGGSYDAYFNFGRAMPVFMRLTPDYHVRFENDEIL